MLNIIRNLVKSIAGKILLLIMVASFAVWGMGDLLRSGDSGLVAIVGNQKITINEFYYQFQKKLNEFNQSLDKELTEEEAHNQQITYLVLNEMVYGKLIQEFAEKNSIYLSNDTIKNIIISIPQFHDANGNFNKILFDSSIISNFNNEAEFTNEISKIFLNNLLFESFTVPTPLNREISNVFYDFESETRDVLYFNIDNTFIKKSPNTDKGTLDFYNDNKNNYLINKEIEIRYLKLNPDTFTSLIDITNEDIEMFYNENIETYTKNETRTIEIIKTNSIEQANKIIKIIGNDIQLTEYLDQEDLSISKLENVNFDDFDEEISNNIFNNSLGTITNPVKVDGIGYFVITINKIIPLKIISFDEEKNKIIELLKDERSYKLFLENIDQIEELNLTGSTLDEISYDYNLVIDTTNIEELLSIVNEEDYRAILNSDVGYQSDLIINDNDDVYIVETVNITDSRIPTYEEIKALVENDYSNFKIDELLSAKISELEIIFKYSSAIKFKDFIEKNSLELFNEYRVERNDSDIFKQSTLDEIFNAPKNSSIMFKGLNDKYGLVFINEIIAADNLINDTNKQKLNNNINASFNQSMENILRNKLGNDVKYELFLHNINNLFL